MCSELPVYDKCLNLVKKMKMFCTKIIGWTMVQVSEQFQTPESFSSWDGCQVQTDGWTEGWLHPPTSEEPLWPTVRSCPGNCAFELFHWSPRACKHLCGDDGCTGLLVLRDMTLYACSFSFFYSRLCSKFLNLEQSEVILSNRLGYCH